MTRQHAREGREQCNSAGRPPRRAFALIALVAAVVLGHGAVGAVGAVIAQERGSAHLIVRIHRSITAAQRRHVLLGRDALPDQRAVRLHRERPDGVGVYPCGVEPFTGVSCFADNPIVGPGRYRLSIENEDGSWRGRTELTFDGDVSGVAVDVFTRRAEVRVDRRPAPGLMMREHRSEGGVHWALRNGSGQPISVATVDGRWVEGVIERFDAGLGWSRLGNPIDGVRATQLHSLSPGEEIEIHADLPGMPDNLPPGTFRLAVRIATSASERGSFRVEEGLLVEQSMRPRTAASDDGP